MSFTMAVCVGARTGAQHEQVQASAVLESAQEIESSTIVEASPTPTTTPTPSPTSAPKPAVVAVDPTSGEGKIEELITKHFGEHAEDAKKIMYCESRGNPKTVGDTHIMTYHSGELVGDSIGLFQIRTGGSDFNRAKANGMTAEEFRQEMFDPEKNIQYAKTIYDQRGWSAWFNCMRKTGV